MAGAKLYSTSCAGCHGPDGSGGRGPNLVSRALWHPLTDEAIFNAIRNGVPGADMPPTKLPDDQTWNLVAFVHSLTGPASENNVPGNVEAGKQVFWGSKAGCSNCHSIRGEGTRMGPDLTNIGSPAPGDYQRVDCHAVQGSVVSWQGRRDHPAQEWQDDRRYRTQSQQLFAPGHGLTGALHLISMTDVKEIKVSDHSPMPDDYAKRLSRDEMRDLLAYLSRQTARTPESIAAKETK